MDRPPVPAIGPGTTAEARFAAQLHASEIPEGFLAGLGPAFLTRLYRRVAASPEEFLLVARADGPIGFLAGTEDTRRLYRRFMARDGLRAGAAAAPHLLRSWRRTMETLRYGVGRSAGPPGAVPLPPAELLSMAVLPAWRGRGVGRALVMGFVSELSRRQIGAGRVVVGSDNASAVALYRACGFRDAAGFEMHAGRRSEILIWGR
jgi:ribosomal protein S18 acetylase RimI-like enzyme